MTDKRRMTTDRFYGGVSNRLQNLRAMLNHVQAENPTRDQLTSWVISNTKANSRDAVNHHLPFLVAIGLIELSEQQCSLAGYGRKWLQTNDSETLYDALSSGVKGFDTLLAALNDEPMTDEDIMNLLVGKFEEAEMSTPGPAIRHREWLQVLGFVERKDGLNRLTSQGETIVESREAERKQQSPIDTSADNQLTKEQSKQDVTGEQRVPEQVADGSPQLTDEKNGYTQTQRRSRDTSFSTQVKSLYDQTCAICGESRETPTGNPEVEAAHIYPKRQDGADDVRNGIALCKLHHWAFDTGWLSVSDDYKILVKDAPNQKGHKEFQQLAGTTITLPENDDAIPHPMYLKQHRELNEF